MGSQPGTVLVRWVSFAVAAVLLYGGHAAYAASTAGQSPARQVPSQMPALYTTAQATAGKQQFLTHCAVCHGMDLQGLAGPALKGSGFAPSKARPLVGDMFSFMANEMPAPQPGSLTHKDYVEIMAFLLQQNGYPAGTQALTYAEATKSKVALIYHGK